MSRLVGFEYWQNVKFLKVIKVLTSLMYATSLIQKLVLQIEIKNEVMIVCEIMFSIFNKLSWLQRFIGSKSFVGFID